MKNFLLISGIMLFLVSCGGGNSGQAKLDKLKKDRENINAEILKLEKEINPKNETAAVPVSVDLLKVQSFDHYIEVQGRIDGNENIGVSPRSAAPMVVTKICVEEGQEVKKGQMLAELDKEVLKQNLTDLKTQLDYATDLYNRQKALWDQKIGSEVQYLTAKNGMESLENKIATLEDQIAMANITSPIDGTVEEIPIKLGQTAMAGVAAFRVINFSKAKAVADIGEAYSAKIKTGDQVKVYLPDLNEEAVCTVTFASKFINATNRTFLVEAQLPPAKNDYRANMVAVLRILDYSNHNSIAIPQNYIQASRDEGQFVFLAIEKEGKKIAHKQTVIPGVSYNGLTEILNGLQPGDKIVTAGYKDLYEGQLIDFK